jgi:ubiquinone/menaquinone biosynthesis C-methylase UbiE
LETTSSPVHPTGTPDKDKIAEHWSKPNLVRDHCSEDVFWLANSAVQARYQRKAVRGGPYATWYEYCVKKYLGPCLPVENMLSIGCGEGVLEFALHALKAFKSCDAFDIAPGRIQRAKLHSVAEGIKSISFQVCDIEKTQLPSRHYDAVWFKHSLHHIFKLEEVLENVAQALKPSGYLFVNEYIGPNCFEFSEREKELARCTFRLLPATYRRSFAAANRGEVLERLGFPEPAEVCQADPSESVRSSEIIRQIERQFEVIEFNPCGGTLLQFLLGNIMGNFRTTDEKSMKLLQLLFAIEDTLLDVAEIQTHFAVVVARRGS